MRFKKCGIVVPFKNKKDIEEFPTYEYGKYLNQKDLQKEINGINSFGNMVYFLNKMVK